MKDIPISDKIPELDIAIKAANEAGRAILEIYQGDYETSTKNDDSPITDADLKSNEVIKEILSQTEHQILSEEDKDDLSRLSKETIWIVDPLDGTSDFIDKTGEFTVMISLIKNKKPILGVIGWPTEKTLFVAQKGSGAFRFSNDQWEKISVTQVSEIPKCRTIGSRHHLSEKEKAFINKSKTAITIKHLKLAGIYGEVKKEIRVFKTQKGSIIKLKKLNEDFFYLFGLIASDGNNTKEKNTRRYTRIKFHNKNEKLVNYFLKTYKKIFPTIPIAYA